MNGDALRQWFPTVVLRQPRIPFTILRGAARKYISLNHYKSIFKTSLNLKSNYYVFATGYCKPKMVGKHCFTLKPEIRLLPDKRTKNIQA